MDSTTVSAISAVITALATGVMIWAVYVAPQKAFEGQWALQQREEARKRRLRVFTTLMATRGNVLHYRHVESLNLIDVEFSEPAEKDIRDAWKTYLDHLNNYSLPSPTQQPDEEKRKEEENKRKDYENQFEERRRDLLAELLQKMGVQLGYGFDFTYLKNRAYYPQGHGTEAEEQSALRKGLIEVLWKGRSLMVRAIEPPVKLPEEKPTPTANPAAIPPA